MFVLHALSMDDGPHLLLIAFTAAATLLIFWRVVLLVVAIACLTVFLVGLLDVAQWTRALS